MTTSNRTVPDPPVESIEPEWRNDAPARPSAAADSDVPPEIIERLAVELAWFESLLPGHKLPLRSVAAAVMQVMPPFDDWIPEDARRFAEKTRIKPDTRAYKRAEFRNVLYSMAKRARGWNGGKKGPYYLALYSMMSACGFGPHPDRKLIEKWRSGLTAEDHETRERTYKSWFNHLRNRMALVRRALDANSGMSARQRASTLKADPLIAEGERARQGIRKQAAPAAKAS